jgi:hypothetical protein
LGEFRASIRVSSIGVIGVGEIGAFNFSFEFFEEFKVFF